MFEYQNGREERGRLGVSYSATKGAPERCELYLLDVHADDPRIEAYLAHMKSKITNKTTQEREMTSHLATDDKGGLSLRILFHFPLELSYQGRITTLTLKKVTSFPDVKPTDFLVIPKVEKGLNYSTKEFLSYIMNSSARG